MNFLILKWKNKKTNIFFAKIGRNFDANLLKKWTFENPWNHFEVLLHKKPSGIHGPQNRKMRGSPVILRKLLENFIFNY